MSWYQIPLDGGYPSLHWGWVGPQRLGADEDLIILMDNGGAWIGRPATGGEADDR
jgi:hypothetical protein